MSDDTWQPSVGFKVGDRIRQQFPRSWLDIWRDRVMQFRWDVPRTEFRTFVATSVYPGGIWPEVED